MAITLLDSENADLDLTALITVLTDTPHASENILCQGYVAFGDGAKDLDGTGGMFELVVTVGGQTVQPSPQVMGFGTEVRSAIWTTEFPVPANDEVILRAKSPNVADSDVDVTAYLFDVMQGTDGANTTVPDAAGTAAALHGTTDGKIDINKTELDGLQGTDGKCLVSTDAQDLSSTLDVNAKTVGDKIGYSLSTAGIKAIWDQLTSALTTVGSIGKLLVDNINATISSRSSHNAAAVKTAMEAVGSHLALIKTDVTFLRDIEGGRWRLVENQMIFYKSDNITEVARFDLKDLAGDSTMAEVFERVRV